ncbi:MAG: hypothetical protein K8T90_13550 [Planctomycetes bacterium]|nr:hypothetical protein [Planctomycetota bacterium]
MAPRLELTAASVEDPRLDERLRAESPEARRALLTEADALTRGSRDQRQLAAAVYRALHDDIDPAGAQGARRAAWFVHGVRVLDPAAAPLVRKAAAACPDPEARMRARLLAARFTAAEGDVRSAETQILDVMTAARGTGSSIEASAFFHAARVAADHEDCVRALAYSARALAVAAPDTPPHWTALAHRCRADAFGAMRDGVRCERELRAAEGVMSHLDPDDRRSQRAAIAAARGRALLRLGRADGAIGNLDAALAETDGANPARAAVTTGGAAAARPHALALLDRLDAEGRRVAGPGCRTRLALAVAAVLCEARVDLAEPRRAYDLAATSQLEAVSRLDREAATQPELLAMASDDLAALSEHRDRVHADRAKVATEFRRYFEAAARRSVPAFLAALAGDRKQVAACAWCGRIRGSDGRWLPVAHHLPTEDVLDLTHAICDDCMLPVVRSASHHP